MPTASLHWSKDVALPFSSTDNGANERDAAGETERSEEGEREASEEVSDEQEVCTLKDFERGP